MADVGRGCGFWIGCAALLLPFAAQAQRSDPSPWGNSVGTFQGDPAQAPKSKPRTSPPSDSKPPRTGRDVIIVAPSLRDRYRPLQMTPWDQHRQATERALSGPMFQTYSWVDGSGSGEVQAIGERFVDGMACRDLKKNIRTVSNEDETVATYCRGPENDWLLLVGER